MLERELALAALDNALRPTRTEDIQYTDLHILDDKQNIIPFLPKRAQEHFLPRMTGRDLILKARQMGFSTAIEAWLFKEALNKTSRIGILAHDDETTQKMRDMHQLFYDQLPEHRRPERAINNATRTYYPRTKSMVYIGTAGNTNQGRGGTYSHVHGCLSPNSQIVSPNGRLVRMGDMQIGDSVVTHNGNIALISFISHQSKQAFNVTMKGLRDFTLLATGEHRFYSASGWMELSQLNAGDLIGYPVATIENDGVGWQFKQPDKVRPQGGGSREHVPDYICPSYELGRVIGLFLAEGSIAKQSKSGEFSAVTFTVHEKEVVRTCEWLNAVDGIFTSYKVSPVKDSKTVHITAYGKSFATFMHNIAGETDSKQLPADWDKKGVDFVRGLVHGYLAGDGHFSANRDRRISAPSIRSAITIGMRDALASLGYGWASIQNNPPGFRNGRNEREQWVLRLTGSGVIDLSKELGKPFVEYQHPQKGTASIEIKNGYAWIPIVSIKPNGQTDVMDFEVNHPDHSYCTLHGATHNSEVAFWKDAGKTLSGLMQGVPKDGSIILESTPNGARGWFYQQCMDALDGKGIWTLHFYAWWWDDRYRLPLEPDEVLDYTAEEQALVDAHTLAPEQIKWRRSKIEELHESFKQEYPEDPYSCFLASGNSYFGNIEQVYSANLLTLPIPGRRYVAGLDFGQSTDYTVLAIFDAETFEMVAMLRINQMPWQEMRRQISIWTNRFNAEVIGEANSMGDTNIELLQSGETLANGSRIEPINLTPFDTTPQSKPPLIQGLHHALHESGMTLLDDPVIKHEFRSFISRQSANGHWSYEAVGDEHDDIVIACALAWHGINMPPKKTSVYRLDGGGLYSSRRS